jgi:multimeric flavodoxin WrbA
MLNDVDAIIVGSPSVYGNMTLQLRQFFDNVKWLSTENWLRVAGKKGAVFGSYAWDGGWHTQQIAGELVNLGIELVVNPLAVKDRRDEGNHKVRGIRDVDLAACQTLGETVAHAVADP